MLHITSIEIIGGVSFFDLQPDHCRWPLDGGAFCGEARREDSSYCDCHHARAYVAPGGRAFSVGGFMRFRAEKVEAAREGIARALQPPEKHSPIPLDQFVRAAAAMRPGAPPPRPAPPQKSPEPPRRYLAPRLSEAACVQIEEWYLAGLARQCARMDAERAKLTQRGEAYAIALRDEIAHAFGMTVDEILSARRKKEIVQPRQFAMFCVAMGACRLSLPTIGRKIFGGFDHTTVIHARDKIGELITTGTLPPRLAAVLEMVCARDVEIAKAAQDYRRMATRLEHLAKESA